MDRSKRIVALAGSVLIGFAGLVSAESTPGTAKPANPILRYMSQISPTGASLSAQISIAVADKAQDVTKFQGDDCTDCDPQAHSLTTEFLDRVPDLRHRLNLDVLATFDGDPAAVNHDETIFCYPGIDAIFIYRVAHDLWKLKVPLIPRIISEYAHYQTGIDIHPGATIGKSFFLDHGTGVVIGETTIIGDRVKIYQGVTLGALSTKGGQAWRGRKRHPTIEDDVTIYGGAIILGGETVIGEGSTIGGSVFLTRSVPPQRVSKVDC